MGFLYPPPVKDLNSNNNNNNNNNSNQNNNLNSPLITPLGNANMINSEILTTSTQNNTSDEKKQTPASTRAKPISCLTFSPDGNYIAAGEVHTQALDDNNNLHLYM